jgi:hypothetical protein
MSAVKSFRMAALAPQLKGRETREIHEKLATD